jgi:hypothetical protein
MPEIIVNLHMHTRYSDGSGLHSDIAQAALKTGLDVVIITDHNILVDGIEGYYKEGERKVLVLVGEEIHDRTRLPQKSHLLVFGTCVELSGLSGDLERLLNTIERKGGLAFAAHPFDPAAPLFGEEDLSWEDWDVTGLTGLEIWNGFSEFKSLLKNWLLAFYYAFNPLRITRSPFPEALQKWDEQLVDGKRVVGIGGSDAHALQIRIGPIKRTIFPYEYHFRAINTHLLIDEPLSGDLTKDRALVMQALKRGRAFIAYDYPASGRGFNFSAHGYGQSAMMGEEISAERGITIQVKLPRLAECRLICNGRMIKTWENHNLCTYLTTEPGAYRVEAYLPFQGRRTGWIFSNPIYIRK